MLNESIKQCISRKRYELYHFSKRSATSELISTNPSRAVAELLILYRPMTVRLTTGPLSSHGLGNVLTD